MKNLATCLLLTERDDMFYEGLVQADGKTAVNPPKYKGRITTTLQKAKEVRPLVEKCITLAKKALPHMEAAEKLNTTAERGTDAWKQWREGEGWQKWNAAIAPAINYRRRAFALLGDKEAVSILFEDVAPRFVDRDGGYTRILKLAGVRLGDAGVQGILEFVGKNDRVKVKSAVKPAFGAAEETASEEPVAEEKPAEEETAAEEQTSAEASPETEETSSEAQEPEASTEDE